jgi:hypothetical protein
MPLRMPPRFLFNINLTSSVNRKGDIKTKKFKKLKGPKDKLKDHSKIGTH